MTEPLILVVPTGALASESAEAVKAAGIILIECDDPSKVVMLSAQKRFSGDELLAAALKAALATGQMHDSRALKILGEELAKAMIASIEARHD